MRHNPYLLRFRELERRMKELGNNNFFMEKERYPLCQKYSFAVPDSEAVRILIKLSPVVELGAGTGYWANLVRRFGGKIDAFDSREGKYGFKTSHFPVQTANESILEAYGPEWTLFLSWPCYDTRFAHDALKAFEGNRLCYVGEGSGGCTGDDRFHWELEQNWEQVLQHRIPQWPGIHDRLTVYKRREG